MGGPGPDVRRCPVQPAGRGDRGTGVRRDRPGGRGRDPPVDRRDRAAGRRAAPVALVHRGAVAPGAAARGGLRHHEPVPVHRDRPARPRPGGDAGVPRPARRRPGHVAPPGGPRVRAGGRRGRGRADPPAAGHRLSRHRPGPTGRRLLGQLHPAQPGDRTAPARRRGLGGGRGAVRAGLRAGRDHGAAPAPADADRARVRGHRGGLVLGRAAPGRPAGAAPGPGRLLRHLHERQPGAGRTHRPADPAPVAVGGGVAEHRRHRRRQRGRRRDPPAR